MNEKSRVVYSQQEIAFSVIRWDASRLSITVTPSLEVCVKAPRARTMREIESRVLRRGAWIVRQLEELGRFLPKQPERRYVPGETHRYLGRQYRLKVEAPSDHDGVKLKGGHLIVSTRTAADSDSVKSVLLRWYRQRARDRFELCLGEAMQRHRRHGLSAKGLRLQAMKRRWGSYTGRGVILLNPELIKAPVACIEYVVVHELCHSRVSGHGSRFEELLTRCLPDWRARKARLESLMA